MQILFDLEKEEYDFWEDHLIVVEIEGDNTLLNGRPSKGVPVSKTPLLFLPKEDRIAYGYEDIMREINGLISTKSNI